MKPDLAIIMMFVTMILCVGVFAFATTAESPHKHNGRLEIATFAGGCFWCIEADFESVEGVKKVISGYTGAMTRTQIISPCPPAPRATPKPCRSIMIRMPYHMIPCSPFSGATSIPQMPMASLWTGDPSTARKSFIILTIRKHRHLLPEKPWTMPTFLTNPLSHRSPGLNSFSRRKSITRIISKKINFSTNITGWDRAGIRF